MAMKLLLLCFCCIANLALATFGTNNYVEYRPGDADTKIIISAPHGGSSKPMSIQNRDAGCYVDGTCVWSHACGTKDSTNCPAKIFKDSYTLELSVMLADELTVLTGKRPHLIINLLHRSKMDANREINEATFGEQEAEIAYNEYHEFIQQAKNVVNGRGLFIDMHGQTHSEGWVELGYMVTKSRLNSGDLQSKYSSLKYLATLVSVPFDELVRGSESLGGYLQSDGYSTIPSPVNLSPGSGNYYTGGYNVKQHGSRYDGTIDGVQVESPKAVRNSSTGPYYAVALAQAINNFMNKYY